MSITAIAPRSVITPADWATVRVPLYLWKPIAVASLPSIWPLISLNDTDCCAPSPVENAIDSLVFAPPVVEILISLPSRRTRFSLPTKPILNLVPVTPAVFLPRALDILVPVTLIARPSRLVKTILP